jgi:hypothetical protein
MSVDPCVGLGVTRFDVIDVEDFPRCTWLLDYRDGAVILFKGPWVETGADWFAEGAWAGELTGAALLDSPYRCGSGGVLAGAGVTIAPPSHTLEAVYCFSYNSQARWLASNSFACVLGAEPLAHVPRDQFQAVRRRARTIAHGTAVYERVLYEVDQGTMYRLAVAPFRLRQSSRAPRVRPDVRSAEAPFDSYHSYVGRLLQIAGGVVQNARNPSRHHPFGDIVAGMSAGYDSPAGSVIAKSLGCAEAVTLTSARGGRNDSGRRIAAYLELDCYEYPRWGTDREMHSGVDFYLKIENSGWRSINGIDSFLSSVVTTQDAVYAPFADHLDGAIYFNGFYGLIWHKRQAASPEIVRPDNSGAGMDEFRKRVGFVSLPLPFVDAHHCNQIWTVSNGAEMEKYSVGGPYDKPIPRRIVESAGVPRDLVGARKLAASVLLGCSQTMFLSFLNSVVRRYASALEAVRPSSVPGPHGR